MNTLFDKIWDSHVVTMIEEGPTQLYIDRLYCHEVTSPQAFASMRRRGLKPFRPERIYCMPDHNTPTHDQDKPIEDPVSKNQVDTLAKNAAEFGLTHYGMMDERNGIIHVVGPERGLTLPGMTIVCGDSHTSTHGAVGAVAFGIGTSEVEMVMASPCILHSHSSGNQSPEHKLWRRLCSWIENFTRLSDRQNIRRDLPLSPLGRQLGCCTAC